METLASPTSAHCSTACSRTSAACAYFSIDRFESRPRSWPVALTRKWKRGKAPEDVPDVSLPDCDPVHLPALLVERLGVASTSEARRLIEQGGVKLNGSPATGLDVPRDALAGALLQVGKRRFARLTA